MKASEEKLISVIVAVYNIESYVEKCIESIAEQTYGKIELILVDDGSTDKSGVICDRYAEEDSRIRVIHKQNGGLSDARNHGLDAAKGDYIGIVDGDDWVHPQMYEIMAAKLVETGADMCTCWYERSDSGFADVKLDANDLDVKVLSGADALIDIETPHVVAWNKLYKRELFDGIRYPVGRYHEDEFVAHRIFRKCNGIAVVDPHYPLYFYTDRGDSIITNRSGKHIEDALAALQDRVDFAVSSNWDDVVPAVVKRYCDYCIDRYMDIKYGRIDAGRDVLQSLQNCERQMITDHPYELEDKYYRFAEDAKKYADEYIRKDRYERIRNRIWEMGHRLKCALGHNG